MSLTPKHLLRYKDLGMLLVKHGRAGLGERSANGEVLDPVTDDAKQDAERLARDLEEMGPTYVKLGQVLSTRADLLPPAYLAALSRLQEKVKPFPYENVERIVTHELDVRMSNAFSSFGSKPVASASLGQVHRAVLRDGRPVAVKVQRPDIRAQIIDDMDAIENIATFADAHTTAGRRFGFADMVAEFRKSLMAELDYRREADHLVTLGRNLADRPRISTGRRSPASCSRPTSSRSSSMVSSTPIRTRGTFSSPTTDGSRSWTSAWSRASNPRCRTA